ncbi:MAG: hypothetical protein KatS3mg103_0232 [Phycisphaerales bacterium]|nr:MAG: hypothetical protein KatS3mg103_0232 [Phycisphaerales bacterium]
MRVVRVPAASRYQPARPPPAHTWASRRSRGISRSLWSTPATSGMATGVRRSRSASSTGESSIRLLIGALGPTASGMGALLRSVS